MGRTAAAQIKQAIGADFVARPEIIAMYGLTPGLTFEEQFSTASFENILFDCLANDMAIHEQLVEANSLNSIYSTLAWYKNTALSFLDGLPLVWTNDHFDYDLTGVTDAAARKIISRCAVLSSNGRLVFKIATDVAGVTQPLTSQQLTRFQAYMQLVKGAGDVLAFVNDPGDDLKVTLTVQVDVTQIDLETGKLLSVTDPVYPVKDAINNYLGNLEFNGALTRTFFTDAIQKAIGVKNLRFDLLQSKFSGFSFTDIGDSRIPNAGYFVIAPADLTINYTGDEL